MIFKAKWIRNREHGKQRIENEEHILNEWLNKESETRLSKWDVQNQMTTNGTMRMEMNQCCQCEQIQNFGNSKANIEFELEMFFEHKEARVPLS